MRCKDNDVANILGSVPLNVSFRRGLVNTNRMVWLDLESKDVNNIFRWNLTNNCLFTVLLLYMHSNFIQEGVPSGKSPLGKLKIPLIIKIFL